MKNLFKKPIELTNCDGYMVGRGAIGNPFLFRKLKHFLETGELPFYFPGRRI